MKPQRPKAKRTLADFLNRTDASNSTDAIAGDPEIANKATVKPAHIGRLIEPSALGTGEMVGIKTGLKPAASAVGADPAASARGTELKASPGGLRTDLSSKIVSAKRIRHIPEAKPEIDPTEKQRLREVQIHEAELIHKEELTANPTHRHGVKRRLASYFKVSRN